MTVEKLIEQLQKFTLGTNVCIFDHKKNLQDDSGDGSSEGVYPDFEVFMDELEPDEAEYYKEREGKDYVPWVALCFDNPDYEEEGVTDAVDNNQSTPQT